MTSRLVEAEPEMQVPGGVPHCLPSFCSLSSLAALSASLALAPLLANYLLCDVNGAAQMHDAGVALPREFAVLGIGRDPRRHTRHSAPQERVTWGLACACRWVDCACP